MKISRARETADYTITPNVVYRDARLSYRALGLLTYLLHLPDGWDTDSTALAAGRPEGRDAVRTALAEIEAAGYLARRRAQDRDTGRWATYWELSSHPTPGNPSPGTREPAGHTEDGKPGVGKPGIGDPTPENPSSAPPAQTPQNPRSHRRLENRPSEIQALNVSTNPSTKPSTNPPPPTDVTHHRASAHELATTARRASTHDIVQRWNHDRGHGYTRTDLANLARGLDALLDDGANPEHFETTLDIQHTTGRSLGFLPHAYREATKTSSPGPGSPLLAGAQAGASPGRSARGDKMRGWLSVDEDFARSVPPWQPLFEPRVIEGGRSA